MQIRAIPGASCQISLGYPIASHSRTIQGYFSPNSAHCSNGLSRRAPHSPGIRTTAVLAVHKGGCHHAADPILEEPAGKRRPVVRLSDHPVDRRVGAAVDYSRANATKAARQKPPPRGPRRANQALTTSHKNCMGGSSSPVITSTVAASRFTRSRSTPVTIRRRPCCNIARAPRLLRPLRPSIPTPANSSC